MSFDCSRFSFQPWNDFLGVVMQQGRVQLDSDWNDFVAQLTRRIQAGSLDTFGQTVVPRETSDGFRIRATAEPTKDLTIGPGRIYVDGLLAENHGQAHKEKWNWDTKLAELTGSDPVSFSKQPYLPFNLKKALPGTLAADFNIAEWGDGPHLVYVDVWQREVTALQTPELIEKAVGIDTTGRLQTVWQVKVLENIGKQATCDTEVEEWSILTRPSGARLTTSTGIIQTETNPCLVPPVSGYQGQENQLYRVEIHRGSGKDANGKALAPTFKWSRDNATVASRVTGISTLKQIAVEHIKRDDVLGFHGGDWIEILDDRHELHGKPGVLRRIQGGGVDEATQTLTLEAELPDGLFPVNINGAPEARLNTRVRRWDQSGMVRRSDGTTIHNLDSSGESNGIPIPPEGTKLVLEKGILVDFTLEKDLNGKDLEFKTGDCWIFAARIADGSIEVLDKSPPRGIRHHYARLAIVTFSNGHSTDCRTLWPRVVEGDSCDCTVCVHPDSHNNGTGTIQEAVAAIHRRGGGTVCLDAGTYRIDDTLDIVGVNSICIRGQGWATRIISGRAGRLFRIEDSVGVCLQDFTAISSPMDVRAKEMAILNGNFAVISVNKTVDFTLERVNAFCMASPRTISAAVTLSGYLIGAKIRDCALLATEGVIAVGGEKTYLLTTGLRMTGNFLMCQQKGISFTESSFHYGDLRLSDNLLLGCNDVGIELTGGALKGSSIRIENNTLNLTSKGVGIRSGLDGVRVSENEISRLETSTGENIRLLKEGNGVRMSEIEKSDSESPAGGILIDGGRDAGRVDNFQIVGNRIQNLRGHGIVIRRSVGHGIIKANIVESISGAGLIIERDGRADYLSIENNHFLELGPEDARSEIYAAVLLLHVSHVDFVGNLLNGIARMAGLAGLRAGILTFGCGEVRISGNRLSDIGPQAFSGGTIGILCLSPFRHVAISDNTVIRNDALVAPPPSWQALNIGFSLSLSLAATWGYTLATINDEQQVLVGAGGIAMFSRELGSARVFDNRFEATATTTSLVNIGPLETCLFTENHCRVTVIDELGGNNPPVGRIEGQHINASNNRLIGFNKLKTTLALKVPEGGGFVVLGNLSTGPIVLIDRNEQEVVLPAPWVNLNAVES